MTISNLIDTFLSTVKLNLLDYASKIQVTSGEEMAKDAIVAPLNSNK